MRSLLTFVLPVVLAILAVVLNAMVNVRIKFADTKDTAVSQLKGLAWQIVIWAATGLVVLSLAADVLSSDPITGWRVFRISFDVAGLFAIFIMSMIGEIVQALRTVMEVGQAHDRAVTEAVKSQSEALLMLIEGAARRRD